MPRLDESKFSMIARVAYEAERAYNIEIDAGSSLCPWKLLPDYRKQIEVQRVRNRIENPTGFRARNGVRERLFEAIVRELEHSLAC